MIGRMAQKVPFSRSRVRRVVAAGMVLLLSATHIAPSTAQQRRGAIDNLPALGEASVDELSPAAEQRLGDQIWQEFLRVGAVLDDAETTDIIARQATRLLSAASYLGHSESGRPFRFFLIKDPSINAFALPGGYVGIHTGLITSSDQEAEVMSVLAHEIGHVTQRHIARMFGQQRQSSAVMIAAAVLAAMAVKSSPDAAMGVLSLGQTVAVREQLAFSRDAEREADRVGLQILAQSGFDPKAMSSMFERLSMAGRLYDNNAPSYLRTHPLTTERIADIQGRLQSDPDMRKPLKTALNQFNAVEYDWLRAKLMALADTKVDGLRAARLRFDTWLKDPKYAAMNKQGAQNFGIAWAALAQRDFAGAQEKMKLAEQQARQAGIEKEVAPLLMHLRLRLAMDAQQLQEIDRLANEAITAYPSSRAIMRSAVEARLMLGVPSDATAQLARGITTQWAWDPQAWELLGRVEAARGKRTAQHAAAAEQYAIAGAYAAAIEQLTLARTAADADFVTLSKIDARLTVMRARLREEQLERQKQGR